MDAITDIVSKEENVLRQEFAINVTGGTNVMASGAILSAMLLGTKAYYVLNREKNPGQKSYVEELPIPSIGIAKMNDTQQKLDRAEQLIIQVLLNISKSTEILSNNLDEVNSINNSSNNNNNMNNNVNNINQLTLQIINNMNEVGTILKENKKVLFPLEDYTNRKNVKSRLRNFIIS